MSSFTILKSVSIIGLGALIGYSSVRSLMAENSPNRYLASATISKMAAEQYSKTIMDVKVTKSDIGLTESDSSTIEVSVEALQPIAAGIPFSWNLPEGVLVIEGPQYGLLPDFAANQVHEFTLKVSGFNKIKKSFISFLIKGDFGNAKIKQEVLLSSRPEDSFEYVVQQYEKSKVAESKANGKATKESLYKGPIDPKKIIH